MQNAVKAGKPLQELPDELWRELKLLNNRITKNELEVRACFHDAAKELSYVHTTGRAGTDDGNEVSTGPTPAEFPFDLPINVVPEPIDIPLEQNPADSAPGGTVTMGK
jgi:hypothetical protein